LFFFYHYYLFQNEGINNTIIANNSSLPKIIPIDKTHLEKLGNKEKFPLGPIIPPKPGPTFDIDVAAPETAVIKSNPLIERSVVIIKKITI
tara:strand:- start:1 stop:273 length:273 start_codon:yes stop_codon:yes gene_type:complete